MTLDQQMRQVLAELELVSHGSTASWDTSGGHAAPGHRILAETNQAVPDPPHVHYRDVYSRCATDDLRTAVLDRAKAELQQIRVRQAANTITEETTAELDARIVELRRQKWTVKEIALHIRCTETRVRNATVTVTTVEIRELAQQDGMTIRSIAMRTGLSKSDVQRRLKPAA